MNGKKKIFAFIVAICLMLSMIGGIGTAFAAYTCDCEHTHSVENGCYAGCETQWEINCDKEHAHGDACYAPHEHKEECSGIVCTITAEEDPEHVHGEECTGIICTKTAEDKDLICTVEEHAHTEEGGACYKAHVHTAECLSCTKKEWHVHTKACFSGTWPDTKNLGKTPVCGKEEHNHSFLCMSKSDIEAIEASYPSSKHKVPEYEEPYVFMEAQTYINSGYRYIKSDGGNSYPQMFMMGDVSGLEPGEYWTQPGGKRFVPGESNYAVVYCCDRQTSAKQYVMYRQVNLEDANYYGGNDAQKIRSIVMNSYPFISLEEAQQRLIAAGYKDAKKLDESDLINISQLAVWHYANGEDAMAHTYISTNPSSKYPAITPFWKKGDSTRWSGNRAAECEKAAKYLVDYAAAHPVEAPKSQTVVSQVEVTNLSVVEEENGTCTVDLQVSLNTDYSPKKGTAITITATAGEATASVNATGGKTYALQLENYVKGTPIDIEMKGNQYLPKGVYFYEPYAAEGQDPRKVAQNMVGVNEGAVPVGDKVTLSPAVINLQKVNEEGGALTGAEFTLEYIRADESTVKIGTYAVDEAGKLIIDGLMAGAQYKLTETKAPYGFVKLDKPVHFKVAGDGSAKISIVNAPDDVRCENADDEYILTVINCPIPPVDVTVTKEWEGDDEAERPASVKVALQKDGETYEEVELSAENEWTYTWEDLDGNFTWTVIEVEIPEGYTAEVTGENGVYTITNTKEEPEEEIPDEEIPQGDPEKPDDDEEIIIEDDIPLGESVETGDASALWMLLAALSGSGAAAGALIRKRKNS